MEVGPPLGEDECIGGRRAEGLRVFPGGGEEIGRYPEGGAIPVSLRTAHPIGPRLIGRRFIPGRGLRGGAYGSTVALHVVRKAPVVNKIANSSDTATDARLTMCEWTS